MIDYILFVLYSAFILFCGKCIGEKAHECSHKWKMATKISDEKMERDEADDVCYKSVVHSYQMRCEKCGDMKVRWMQ